MRGTLVACPACSNLFHIMEARSVCPICKIPHVSDAFICTKCGFDSRSGKSILTSYDPSLEGLSWIRRFIWRTIELVPGLFAPVNLLVALLGTPFALTMIFFGLIFVSVGLLFGGGIMVVAGGTLYFHVLIFLFSNEHSLAALSILRNLRPAQEILFYFLFFLPLFIFVLINYFGRLLRGLS